MDEPASTYAMSDEARQISDVIAEQRPRLRNFIRGRVRDTADVEDILQEVWYELVRANRLLMPIDQVTGWLFRVARNRIIDLFRKQQREILSFSSDVKYPDLPIAKRLPSPEAGPEMNYLRNTLVDELERALQELPKEQREVFVAHELEGRSFKELSASTGVNLNTLLARKRYAVLHLRARLQNIYEDLIDQ
jgi:RNA polymerase sigma factor (sigma-70 family)